MYVEGIKYNNIRIIFRSLNIMSNLKSQQLCIHLKNNIRCNLANLSEKKFRN